MNRLCYSVALRCRERRSDRGNAILGSFCALLLAACGGSTVPDEPIVLVPDEDVTGRHREAIEFAADSWNLELGTQISVSDDAGDSQSVSVSWHEDECITDGMEFLGKTQLRGSRIFMCSEYTRDEHPSFFEVMRHELGHVLGLGHNSGVTSIMGRSDDPLEIRAVRRQFAPEDRQEFARVNPDFVGLGGCSINHLFAEQIRHETTVVSNGEPYAFWSAGEEILYARIDASTGEQAFEPLSLASTSTMVMQLSVHPTTRGLLVSWAERRGLYRSLISTEGAPSTTQTLSAEWNPRLESVSSNVYVDGSHFLAFSGRPNMTTRVIEVDDGGNVVTSTVVRDRGRLVHFNGELFLIGSINVSPGKREAYVSRFRRADDRLEVVERVSLAETIDVDPRFESALEPVSAQVTSDGLVAIVDHQDHTTLLRISTLGNLEARDRVQLERLEHMTILEEPSQLLIAGWRRPPELYMRELFFASFHGNNFERTSEWTRVSGVDQFGGGPPLIHRSNGRVLFSWGETPELRTRCVLSENQ
jgi:hypothetical protein